MRFLLLFILLDVSFIVKVNVFYAPAASWWAWWVSALWWGALGLWGRLRCWGCIGSVCSGNAYTGHTGPRPRYFAQLVPCPPPTLVQTQAGTAPSARHAANTASLWGHRNTHRWTAWLDITVWLPLLCLELFTINEPYERHNSPKNLTHVIPRVMTAWARTTVGIEEDLNWDRGWLAGNSAPSSEPVGNITIIIIHC